MIKESGEKFTHQELVDLSYTWLIKNMPCGVGFKELSTVAKEKPDVIGFGSGNFSILLEIKTSKSDFKRDAKKSFRKKPELGMGSQRYYVCENNLIMIDDLPPKWGLIWVDKKGECTIIHKHSKAKTGRDFKDKNVLAEMSVMYSGLRRLQERELVDEIYNKTANELKPYKKKKRRTRRRKTKRKL